MMLHVKVLSLYRHGNTHNKHSWLFWLTSYTLDVVILEFHMFHIKKHMFCCCPTAHFLATVWLL